MEIAENVVPLFTLNTGVANLPVAIPSNALNLEQTAALRTMLAAMADDPVTTLEVHRAPESVDKSKGIALGKLSPLAQHLGTVATELSSSGLVSSAKTGETLYRMVMPAKVAGEVGLKAMKSTAVKGGVHSAVVGKTGIVGQASFVPVATGAAGALAIAAPLVLMVAAVGASAYADHQRQEAMDRITNLLEQLHEANLEDERNDLDACRSAIDKATAILLDQGRIGISLGLDTAVYHIDKALIRAEKRLTRWQQYLESPSDEPIDIGRLRKGLPGIDKDGGEFYTHLELARLAIAFKKRVVVLQAVEHTQQESGNALRNFMQTLKLDAAKVEQIEEQINELLLRLSSLQLTQGGRFFTRGELDDVLDLTYRLRALGEQVPSSRLADVAVDILQSKDGSLMVLPAVAM